MNGNTVISDINAPILKGATAITAAVGANTGTVEDAALTVVTSLASKAEDPWWFWFLVSIPWGHIASFVAAAYTSVLFLEWLWKKPVRWLLVKAGVIEPVRRYTATEWAKLHDVEE